jgi:hypothetical protein
MNFKELSEMAFGLWKHGQAEGVEPVTLLVLGPPGGGKTAAGAFVADLMTEYVQSRHPGAPPAIFEPLDLSSMLPEDLMGLPNTEGRDEYGNKVTQYVPQEWLAPLCQENAYGVLVLDDLAAAQSQVQVACRQVSLERRIHKMKLAPGIIVMVTGNRREDKSAARTLPAHFLNSVMSLSFRPDFKGWESWYMEQGYETDIPAFLHYKPSHFSRLPSDGDTKGAFATPRSWSLLGKTLPALDEKFVMDAASALVGEGVATEFAAFRMLRKELVSPAKVMDNPEKALPDLSILNSPDRMVAMATGLGEVAAKRAKMKGSHEELTKYLAALSYVTSKKREYVAVSISTFTSLKGEMKPLIAAARKGQGDPRVKDLIDYLAKALEV